MPGMAPNGTCYEQNGSRTGRNAENNRGRRRLKPHEFKRRILLSATGLSPQIVTETLYALAVQTAPSFVPTEVHLVTTSEGAERAELSLLHQASGWFHRLRAEYGLPDIRFDHNTIHVIRDAQDEPLADIRDLRDNERAADRITETVRNLTSDPQAALHVSIAGGRKTMGFYVGYALSLFGRAQDRLSHVLVNPPYESHPQFFYPTRTSQVIHTAPPDSRPYDTRNASVTLAEIPFVRLRDGIPERLQNGESSFNQAVSAAQRALGPAELIIDLAQRRIRAGGELIELPPADLAFYSWMARRRIEGRPYVRPDRADKNEYLAEYARIVGDMSGEYERVEHSLRNGMEKEYFEQRKSKTNSAIRKALGSQLADRYRVAGVGRRPQTRFGIGVDRSAVRYRRLD